MSADPSIITKPYLGVEDIRELFGCGRSKALLLMHEVGVFYVGHVVYVKSSDVINHIAEKGGIKITWQKRSNRKKRSRHAR